jgi:DNA-binding NarL/FixJ family response regulator
VRLIAVQAGIHTKDAVTLSAEPLLAYLILAISATVIIVVATAFFFSEKQLSSNWGLALKSEIGLDTTSFNERTRLNNKCRELAEAFMLTPREEEVLTLMAQGKRLGDIGHELFVAPSTIKTHSKHIYQKLGIHSKKELLALVGVQRET